MKVAASYRRFLACSSVIALVALCGARGASASASAADDASRNDIGASNFTLSGRSSVNQSNFDVMASPPAPGLLQSSLRDVTGGFMEQYGLRLLGYGEVGYSYNFKTPANGDNGFGRLFDDKAEDLRIDQISLSLIRDAQIGRSAFDLGFGVQFIYGSDARSIHANGANFYGSGIDNNPIQRYPDEQIDLTQLYVTANLPIGNGLLLTGGKFVTPWGLEHIDPTQNLFYSHSLLFGVASPKTLTGITASYRLDDQWSAMGGVVTGWNQSIEDNNDFPSLIAQASYRQSDDWDYVLSAIVGPEQNGNRSDFRWLLDGTATYHVQRDWTVGFEAVVGYEPDVGTEFRDVQTDQFGNVQRQFVSTGDDELFFGATINSSWRMTSDGMWTLNLRGEYFNDSKGGRWFPAELYAVTGGVTFVPFPDHNIGKNFSLRPELRYDYSHDDIFDGGTSNNQITFSVDAIYTF